METLEERFDEKFKKEYVNSEGLHITEWNYRTTSLKSFIKAEVSKALDSVVPKCTCFSSDCSNQDLLENILEYKKNL